MSEAPTINDGGLSGRVNSNIRAEAARRGIKLVAVAEAVGFSTVALHRRLTGSVSWDLAELESVAGLLDVPVLSLLDRAS